MNIGHKCVWMKDENEKFVEITHEQKKKKVSKSNEREMRVVWKVSGVVVGATDNEVSMSGERHSMKFLLRPKNETINVDIIRMTLKEVRSEKYVIFQLYRGHILSTKY